MPFVALQTARLRLRRPDRRDAEAIATRIGVWDVAGMLALVPYPYELADARSWLKAQGDYAGPDRVFMLELLDDHSAIGCISLVDAGNHDHGPELGYWLGMNYWRRGLMSEAVERLLEFARSEMAASKIRSGYFADNLASAALQKKFGFEIIGESGVYCRARSAETPHVDTLLTF